MKSMTRAELARELSISRRTLLRLEAAGAIPPAVRESGNRSIYTPDTQKLVRNLVEASR